MALFEENVAKLRKKFLKIFVNVPIKGNKENTIKGFNWSQKITIQIILTNKSGTKKVSAWLVPRDLNFLQKHSRNDVAQVMLEWSNADETFLNRFITGAKTSVYEFEIQK